MSGEHTANPNPTVSSSDQCPSSVLRCDHCSKSGWPVFYMHAHSDHHTPHFQFCSVQCQRAIWLNEMNDEQREQVQYLSSLGDVNRVRRYGRDSVVEYKRCQENRVVFAHQMHRRVLVGDQIEVRQESVTGTNKDGKPNEDQFLQKRAKNSRTLVIGVFDGHGGRAVVDALTSVPPNSSGTERSTIVGDLSVQFADGVDDQEQFVEQRQRIVDTFVRWDSRIVPRRLELGGTKNRRLLRKVMQFPTRPPLDLQLDTSGSTGTVVLIGERRFLMAHVGDSQYMYYVPTSSDDPKRRTLRSGEHKSNLVDELERIRRNGGEAICFDDDGRLVTVNGVRVDPANQNKETFCRTRLRGDRGGGLGMSRAFGDYDLKVDNTKERRDGEPFVYKHDGVVSVEPTVLSERIYPERNSYLVIASDGMWDGVTPDQVRSIIDENRRDIGAIQSQLNRRGREGRQKDLGDTDDTTVAVIAFLNGV